LRALASDSSTVVELSTPYHEIQQGTLTEKKNLVRLPSLLRYPVLKNISVLKAAGLN
jgi:hypothetical protein